MTHSVTTVVLSIRSLDWAEEAAAHSLKVLSIHGIHVLEGGNEAGNTRKGCEWGKQHNAMSTSVDTFAPPIVGIYL